MYEQFDQPRPRHSSQHALVHHVPHQRRRQCRRRLRYCLSRPLSARHHLPDSRVYRSRSTYHGLLNIRVTFLQVKVTVKNLQCQSHVLRGQGHGEDLLISSHMHKFTGQGQRVKDSFKSRSRSYRSRSRRRFPNVSVRYLQVKVNGSEN